MIHCEKCRRRVRWQIPTTKRRRRKTKRSEKRRKKERRQKKEKKEKRKLEGESLQAGESQKAKVTELRSSDSGDSMEAPPSHEYKTKYCPAFLKGQCHKGNLCTLAHSESELLKPGEAASDYRDKLRARAKHPGQGVREPASQVPSNRMRAWPQDKARSRGVAPSQPMMGMPPMMDPMMMGAGPFVVVPPEMIHMQVPQFHPQMAMMMDPYGMQKEKRSKKTKERKEEKDKSKKAGKEVQVMKPMKETKEPKSKKEKGAKHKEKVPQADKAGAVRKERKVDEEDL